jgi:hypothetical protein
MESNTVDTARLLKPPEETKEERIVCCCCAIVDEESTKKKDKGSSKGIWAKFKAKFARKQHDHEDTVFTTILNLYAHNNV